MTDIDLNDYKVIIQKAKNHLAYKTEEWVNSVPIQYAIQNHNFDVNSFYITGGCLASMWKAYENDVSKVYPDEIESVKDYDLFFTKDESMEIMYELYEKYDEWVMTTEKYTSDSDGNREYEKLMTDNAITLDIPKKLQLICRYDRVYQNPEDLIRCFDFQHLVWYYHYGNDKIYLSPKTVDCIINNRLQLNSKARYFETERYERFTDRGWKPTVAAESKYLTEKGK